jgi:ribosomal protein L11 methyltransferase
MNRLVVGVPPAAVEAVANHLMEAGAEGLELRDQETLQRAPDGHAEVVVYVPAAEVDQRVAGLGRYLESLRVSGRSVDPWSWRTEAVEEGEWRERWREFFRAARVGRRLVVRPPWETWSAVADDVVVVVSPGQAFGTGTHASTRLCLRALERLARASVSPAAVLDAGCGSGILGAAAALLWPSCAVTAVDVDPLAVEATERIVRDNALEQRLRVRCVPLAETGGTWDLVLANLQADVLSAHRSTLAGLVRSGGRLVVSGMLAAEASKVAEAYCAAGEIEAEYSEDEGEWRALTLRRG